MKIEVRLYATLRAYGPSEETSSILDVPENSTIQELLQMLGIPDDVERIVLINGRPAAGGSELNDADRVVLFPPAAGG
ncbi:MAG TPA: MoaD/ThiS family protein [Desulfobacteraceae bacterium]|nr:MoaD/ThiS family protein [Desulfobacteraceae bacterium]